MSSSRDIAQGKFNGRGWEFFKIYFINILLTILTLGLYTPWARVRTRRYLLGNMQFGPYRFDYHANPIAMFKTLVILYAIILMVFLLFTFVPESAIVIAIVYGLAVLFGIPWLTNSSLRFNARMTSFANIRFDYTMKYWKTFAVTWLPPIFMILSLGLALPYIASKVNTYYINNHRWGKMPLHSYIPIGKSFAVFFLVFLVPVIISIFTIPPLISLLVASASPMALLSGSAIWGILTIYIVLPLAFFYYALFVQITLIKNMHACFANSETETPEARIAKYHAFRQAEKQQDQCGFLYLSSKQTPGKTCLKIIGNQCLCVLTLGFYIPFMKINLLRYATECITLHGDEGLIEQNISQLKQSGGYLADGIADTADLDIAL